MSARKPSPQTRQMDLLNGSQICDEHQGVISHVGEKRPKGGLILLFAAKLWMFQVSTRTPQVEIARKVKEATPTFAKELPYYANYVSRVAKGVSAPAAWFTEAMHIAFPEFDQQPEDTVRRVQPPPMWRQIP